MVENSGKVPGTDHSKHPVMNICTYNILAAEGRGSDGCNRLEQVMRCMRLMNIDLGILTETKLVQGCHTVSAEGYDIVASAAKSKHQGGVALFYRKSKNFHVEGTRTFGPNVIGATLVAGRKRWRIVGAYIPPSEVDGSTLDFIQAAAAAAATSSQHIPLILLGDLNVDLKQVDAIINERQIETAALLSSLGLTNLNNNFVQRKRVGDWTWFQRREGRRIVRRCDYILATDTESFQALRIKTPRYNSDHRMVMGILRLDYTRQHKRYVEKRARFNFHIRPEDKERADFLMEELASLIEKPITADPKYSSWISAESWKLVDSKAEARRCGNGREADRIGRQLRKNLRADRKRRIDKTATEIEFLLKDKQVQAAYGKLRGWYRDKPGHVPKPTIQDEEKTRLEYQDLYAMKEPPGEPLPIHITPSTIDDSSPSEKEICMALKKMKRNKSPGASGIRAEHLLDWMNGANNGEPTKIEAWNKVLELVELVFTGKPLPKSFGTGILVLIPKGVPDQYRGIALLEVIYKLVSAIINRRLTEAIAFHDAVHGFCTGRGTGTATIELKLRMQLAQRTNKPLYFVFLDLKKAYDTLDRGRTLEILKGYGLGENILRIIAEVWEMDTMVPKQAGFYGKSFSASRGVRQGDILSPMIFNIIADAVIRDTEARANIGRDLGRPDIWSQFYADDGLLISEDPVRLQHMLDLYTDGFARVGLKMNAEKTKAMTMAGGKLYGNQSTQALRRRVEGVGLSYRERSLQKVICQLCGAEVNRQHLKTHQTRRACETGQKDYQATTTEEVVEMSTDLPESEDLPSEYSVSMDGKTVTPCPVIGCPVKPKVRGSMRKHFRAVHIKDVIVVEDEGPLPRCERCGLFQQQVGLVHQQTADCKRWAAIREKRAADKVYKREMAETVFNVQGVPIENVSEFKYLGRVVNNKDDDRPAVRMNLKKARAKWGRISRILSKEGANPKAMASFYKAIVQSVLLYGSESWVLTLSMENELQSFHRRCARYITGQHIRQNADGTWTCPSSKDVLEQAGLWTIQEYIKRRRNTVMKYAESRFIYRQCVASKPLASNPNQLVWWKPDGGDFISTDA